MEVDTYKFHPVNSNYKDVVKECIKVDTIFFLRQTLYGTLWGNSYIIPKIKGVSKRSYALSAVASQMLLMYTEENKDSVTASRNLAMVLYFGERVPKGSEENAIWMLKAEMEVDEERLLTTNYAAEAVLTAEIPINAFSLALP